MKKGGRWPVILLVMMLLISVPLAFVSMEWTINTSPEGMMLDAGDLPDGWECVYSGISCPGEWGSRWLSSQRFENQNITIGNSISILILSFNFSDSAIESYEHQVYWANIELMQSNWEYNDLANIQIGNEGFRLIYNNAWGSYVEYIFRVKNICVGVQFMTALDANPYEIWMDEIVRIQESKIK